MTTRARILKVWTVGLLAAMGAAMVALAVVQTKPAKAAFPGSNGAIAFTCASNNQLCRMSPDGFGLTQISSSVSNAFQPDWSADGKKIVFVEEDFSEDIYWTNWDGSGEKRLTSTVASDDTDPAFFPNLSPNQYTIAFTSDQSGGDLDIIKMTVDGTGAITDGPTALTTSAANDSQPAVSPNGKKIAFTSNRGGNVDIYVMKANAPESSTNKPVKLTRNTASDSYPEWAPSGKKLAFESNRSGNAEIWLMKPRPEGRKNRPKNLTKHPAEDWWPAFSPDGRKLVFASNRGVGVMLKMKSDGSGQVIIPGRGMNPSWQPDP